MKETVKTRKCSFSRTVNYSKAKWFFLVLYFYTQSRKNTMNPLSLPEFPALFSLSLELMPRKRKDVEDSDWTIFPSNLTWVGTRVKYANQFSKTESQIKKRISNEMSFILKKMLSHGTLVTATLLIFKAQSTTVSQIT